MTAIVKGRERTLKAEEVALVRRTYAKEATEEEFLLFMTIAKKHKLDPFTGQIYCVIFTGQKTGRNMVIITGIGGYRAMAARSHRRQFGGTSKPSWTFDDKDLGKTPAGRRIPDSATVYAYRKGDPNERPSGGATVFWEEFAPTNLSAARSDFWNRMPKHMLAKCAEAQALRKAFPDLSNIYSTEELSQKLQDLTPGGRLISNQGVAPSGSIVDPEAQAQANAKMIAQAKQRGDWCDRHQCVRGWCANQDHSAEEKEIFRSQDAQQEKALQSRTIDVDAKATTEPKPKHKDLSGCELRRGTIHRVVYGKTTGERKVPYINIRINQEWHTIWSKTLHAFFPNEADVVARAIEYWVKPSDPKNILGLKRIGTLNFREDGRTPIAREPGDE